ncbi:MAG: DUF3883 domain-containing protein, partial [Ginsengibacter sp.]
PLLIQRKFQAFLLFNQEKELLEMVEGFRPSGEDTNPANGKKQLKVRGITIEYDDYATLGNSVMETIDIGEVKMRMSKTSPVEPGKGRSKKRGSKSSTRRVSFQGKNEEQTGFVAELICYHKLVQKYGEQNVRWVSENACRAYPDKFFTAEAGKGYDLELTEQGKVRFLEVKGTSDNGKGIQISENELRTAIKFPDKYDLVVVESPLGDPSLRYVKAPFKFRKEESLLKNNKLTVLNENYLLKFKWDD